MRYLENNGKLEIWDIMGDYNHVIAQSATMTEAGEQMKGRAGRAKAAFINSMRFELFKKWTQANMGDPSAPTEEEKRLDNCVARVLNRFGADIKRKDCVLVKLLAVKLIERLGYKTNLNAEAMFRLAATAYGFYEGAKEALRDVKL
jgi:hypothetical protein